MTLHIVKLCVGVSGLEEFEQWRAHEKAARRKMDHVTRMFPKRADEVLDGGSIYWVIKSMILVRQPIVGLKAVTGADGIERCRMIFDPDYVLVRPTPRRAFQGWRYLDAADAPPDLAKSGTGAADMPEEMRAELAALGLL
ncbi:MAG: DUF1489 domain-containing protein [Aestuariivirgaceae bacterium]|nr:DUF1489 domain-containing protein [Aestuariivirgaceae bacterium]